MSVISFIIGFLIPPFGAWRQVGFSAGFWVNCVLTLIGYLPGSLHAIYLMLRDTDGPAT